MDIRVLRYFLAVAREESISGAAEYLHLSQSTLSRQLSDLEAEIGKSLFTRGSRRITLTEQGTLLRKRAEEIIDLMEKTIKELTADEESIAGDIYIGAGETEAVHYLTQAARKLKEQCPDIHIHIASGDTVDVTEQLDKGLIDFGLLFGRIDEKKYNSIALPTYNTWGIIMLQDDPLARKEFVTAADIIRAKGALSNKLSGYSTAAGILPPLCCSLFSIVKRHGFLFDLKYLLFCLEDCIKMGDRLIRELMGLG